MKRSKGALYAKVFREVASYEKYVKLQRDLAALNQWCAKNFLALNVEKCVSMSFFRIHNPFHFCYEINGTVIRRVTKMRDLGVTFTENLSFNRHIDIVVAKAYSMLGFVKRMCRNFNNVDTLKSLYFAYVRSQLEYASVVWSPTLR